MRHSLTRFLFFISFLAFLKFSANLEILIYFMYIFVGKERIKGCYVEINGRIHQIDKFFLNLRFTKFGIIT